MKRIVFGVLTFALLSMPTIVWSAHESEQGAPEPETMAQEHVEDANAVYTCPMHPDVRRAEPGRCPICGMNLERSDADKAPTHQHAH